MSTHTAMQTTISLPMNDAADATLAAARRRNEHIWRESGRLLYSGRIAEFLTYWTADARYEVAYPVTGIPAAVTGHDALRVLFGGLAAAASSIEVHDVKFHQTDDPRVAIVQERMVAELHGGGRYENLLIIVVTFSGGLIAEAFEYYGQHAHQNLLQQLGFAH